MDKVLTPTLIVWGQNDKISPIRTAKVLNHRLKNSQLKILADSGHTPMQDQPESFNKLIIQFLLSDNSLYEHTKDSFIEHKQEIANCNNMESFTLTGSYDRVNINNCNNAVIKNSKINELSIFESRVVIYDTEIGGDVHTALKTTGADVKITNSKISGDIAIKSDRSRLDLASVDFYPTITAIAGLGLSRIIFSVCRIYSGEKIKHVHQSAKVEYGSFR